MRENFNTEELRNTSEEIRTAVMAKSITPEMVGGTLLALVNAQGEVIEALGELQREHVTVKVNAYDGSQREDVTGAKVYVDMFSAGTPIVNVPRQELEVDANGEVSFDVIHGYQYAVFSKLEGFGASFQLVFQASQENRTIALWNLPLGVFYIGMASYCLEIEDEETGDSTSTYRYLPYITENYVSDWEERREYSEWGLVGDEYMDEDYYGSYILVSTEDGSFMIEENSYSDETKTWVANRLYGKMIPTLPAYDGDVNDWSEMQAAAQQDMDGNLNTAKILAFCGAEAPAALWCVNEQSEWKINRWLPSAGQLYLMYLNRAAIDALMTAANDEDGHEFRTVSDDYYWHWSSTQYNAWCAWRVNVYYGSTNTSNRYHDSYVRAVSAFLFDS